MLEEGSHQAYAQKEAVALTAVTLKAQAFAFTCTIGQTDAWPTISFQTGKHRLGPLCIYKLHTGHYLP